MDMGDKKEASDDSTPNSSKSTVTEDMAEDVLVVEKVASVRTKQGKTECLVQWKGLQHSKNTWVPAKNVFSTKSVKQLQQQYKLEPGQTCRLLGLQDISEDVKFDYMPDTLDRDFEPEKIVHVMDSFTTTAETGELMYLMKWKKSEVLGVLPSRTVKEKCPQLAINFYGERIVWLQAAGSEDRESKQPQNPSPATQSQPETSVPLPSTSGCEPPATHPELHHSFLKKREKVIQTEGKERGERGKES